MKGFLATFAPQDRRRPFESTSLRCSKLSSSITSRLGPSGPDKLDRMQTGPPGKRARAARAPVGTPFDAAGMEAVEHARLRLLSGGARRPPIFATGPVPNLAERSAPRSEKAAS